MTDSVNQVNGFVVTDLPNKPSELIRLAISDMKKSIASGVEIDMGLWMDPEARSEFWRTGKSSRICSVCMAGAVMLNTLKSQDIGAYSPGDYAVAVKSDIVDSKLYFLNRVRDFNHSVSIYVNCWFIPKLTDEERKNLNKETYLSFCEKAKARMSYSGSLTSYFVGNVMTAFGDDLNYNRFLHQANNFTSVMPYRTNPELFFKTVEWLAEDFVEAGL